MSNLKMRSYRFPKELIEKLKKAENKTKTKQADIVRTGVENYLNSILQK